MVIYTKMVGDLFHPGHVAFLAAARALGDRLVVYVVSDERVVRAKKREPIMNQSERIAVIAACRFVDEVADEGPLVITQAFMRERGYAIYAYGFCDPAEAAIKRKYYSDLLAEQVALIPYTPGISTTLLRERIRLAS